VQESFHDWQLRRNSGIADLVMTEEKASSLILKQAKND
jgi:hypothetical protein